MNMNIEVSCKNKTYKINNEFAVTQQNKVLNELITFPWIISLEY